MKITNSQLRVIGALALISVSSCGIEIEDRGQGMTMSNPVVVKTSALPFTSCTSDTSPANAVFSVILMAGTPKFTGSSTALASLCAAGSNIAKRQKEVFSCSIDPNFSKLTQLEKGKNFYMRTRESFNLPAISRLNTSSNKADDAHSINIQGQIKSSNSMIGAPRVSPFNTGGFAEQNKFTVDGILQQASLNTQSLPKTIEFMLQIECISGNGIGTFTDLVGVAPSWSVNSIKISTSEDFPE